MYFALGDQMLSLKYCSHGPLARYVKLWVAHAPGMLGTFSPPPRVSDPDRHHGTCVTHAPWCVPGSLISGFLWSRWRGKRSRHSRHMRNPQFCVSSKRPMGIVELDEASPVSCLDPVSRINNLIVWVITGLKMIGHQLGTMSLSKSLMTKTGVAVLY